MAIKGLTDRDPEEALHLGYPKIATLYKGDPKITQAPRQRPRHLPHRIPAHLQYAGDPRRVGQAV